ncbi:MAG TPA: TonB family protein [Caulobacteraceae bacterium]|nr:TonB family protein [Caulobacteraceae bacterium]
MAAAWGSAQGQGKDVVTSPNWLRKPSEDELRAAYPTGAKASEGSARITCTITVQGLVRNCKVTSEDPPDQGFGSAAIALTPQFLFRPATRNGRPFETEATIPIHFDCGGPCKAIGAGGRRIVSGLNWAIAPTQQQMVAAYPPKAFAQHILGVASIQCSLTGTGTLKNCETMSEEPRNQGFGRAAITLAKVFAQPTNVGPNVKLDGNVTRLTFTFGEQMYDGAPYVAKPRYSAVPTVGELLDAYRAVAGQKAIASGEATVLCKIVEGGALSDCQVTQEAPTGKNLGKAVLAAAPKFKIATWTDDGLPVIGTSVRLPIKFNIKDPPVVAQPTEQDDPAAKAPLKATNAP